MKKIISFIKGNIAFFITIALILVLTRVKLPYVIYTPGGSIDLKDRVTGDGVYPEKGSLSMTYVSMVRGAPVFVALSYVMPNWDLVSTSKVAYDNEDMHDTIEIDKIYLAEAYSNAEYVAYKAAGIDFDVKETKNIVTQVSSKAKTNLKYNDEVIKIDDTNYNSLEEFQNYISNKKVGDKVTITYKRNNKIYTDDVKLVDFDGTPKVGIGIATLSSYNTKYNIKIETKSSESGPSGGFLTALEIYNKITSDDLTKGRTIMGTGTISKTGKVGEIGGVKYKVLGAARNGAEIFICPKENEKNAKEAVKKNNLSIKVIGVSTFDEAIEALK